MSRLQDLVNSLMLVITGYNKIILGNDYLLNTLIAQSHDELEQTLLAITNEATTNRGYEKRRPLFDYFLYEIKTLKPLVDKKGMLSAEESEKIKNDLTTLINTVKLLLTKYQNESVAVNYNGNRVEIVGAKYGWNFSQSGTVLNNWLHNPHYFPTEFDTATFIQTTLEEHQAIVSYPVLKSQINSARTISSALQEELNVVKKTSSALQKELISTQKSTANLQVEFEQLQKLHASLQEEHERLKQHQAQGIKPNKSQTALANKVIAAILCGNHYNTRQQYQGSFFAPKTIGLPLTNPGQGSTHNPDDEARFFPDLSHS